MKNIKLLTHFVYFVMIIIALSTFVIKVSAQEQSDEKPICPKAERFDRPERPERPDRPEKPFPPKPEHCKPDFCNIPDLSEEQIQKIHSLKIKFIDDIKPFKNEIGEKMAKLKTLTTAESPDIKLINKIIDEISIAEGNLKKQMISTKLEVRKLLNNEQRILFDENSEVFDNFTPNDFRH